MAQIVKRAYKYRFYPTPGQAEQPSRTFGCVRLVYNKALEERTRAYKEGRRVSYAQTSAALTEWKRTTEWGFLNEVSCVPLQQALRHLQAAFANFFTGRARHPVFKSRKKSRALPDGAQPSTVTVSRDAAGRWYASILVEEKIVPLPPAEAVIGVDVGITALMTLSTGEKILNSKQERADRGKLARAQRILARKTKGSANRAKANLVVARIHARITDRRRDHLHKITTRLVRENQVIAVEDLAVRHMVKNRSLARAISDASWRELRSMLAYKAAWYGRELLVVDRWFPSGKLCSACGARAASMPLSVREWVCACGASLDRDAPQGLRRSETPAEPM
ncbi:RNA-guided endonuclease InsQ/TnpB family protein [Herbidospora yilanensis]|uniref:RNA-guided endonuclease InsQ/TnpB family protein n=1 Tax=Herbidospora yilanensis TaxID=354426 RepID=UPI000B14C1F2